MDLVKHGEGSDPAAVVFDAINAGKARGCDVVICDTAGRLHNKKNLMDELSKISRVVHKACGTASVEIKRRLPDTVVITATPAVETCTVESAAGWAVLSQSYKVLRVDAEAPAGLVRIDGAQADAPAPGQPVKFTEEDKLSVLQTVLSKAQAQGLGPISEVDLTNTLELSFLYQDRIRIVLGTTNDLDYKIKWAWEMVTPGQTSDSLGEEERGTLDVSSRGEDGLGRARWRAGVL